MATKITHQGLFNVETIKDTLLKFWQLDKCPTKIVMNPTDWERLFNEGNAVLKYSEVDAKKMKKWVEVTLCGYPLELKEDCPINTFYIS